MPAIVTSCLPSGSGQLELESRSVAGSDGNPRSASSCKRLAASSSVSFGSSVCAVSAHFNGTPTTQKRSRTPTASRWLRISRPTSSGAAVSGSSESVTAKVCCCCNEPLVRFSTTPSSRLPSSDRPSRLVSFLRFAKLTFKTLFIFYLGSAPATGAVFRAPAENKECVRFFEHVRTHAPADAERGARPATPEAGVLPAPETPFQFCVCGKFIWCPS